MRIINMVERTAFALGRSRSHTVQHMGQSVWCLGTAMHRRHLRNLGIGG